MVPRTRSPRESCHWQHPQQQTWQAITYSSCMIAFSLPHFPNWHPRRHVSRRPCAACCTSLLPAAVTTPFVTSLSSQNPSFADRILDYIQGGPKLRRWYGAPDLLPKDGELEEEEEEDASEIREAVLVTNGDTEIGQMIILSLILKRVKIKALVKNKRASDEAFGSYVEAVGTQDRDKLFLKKALRGIRAIISVADEGFFSQALDLKGVEHIVLLSQSAFYGSSTGLRAMMHGELRKLAERDEELVVASGIPYTIVKTGELHSSPGDQQGFRFEKGVAAKGEMSKEDAAKICVEALEVKPQKGFIFEVGNGYEKVSNWTAWFTEQLKNAET